MKKVRCLMFRLWLFGALMFFLAPVHAGANEVIGAAYTPDELAKVKDWEKTWVGKKIDKTNIDQVAAFIPESYVGLIKEPTKWGAPPEGNFFTIGTPIKSSYKSKFFFINPIRDSINYGIFLTVRCYLSSFLG